MADLRTTIAGVEFANPVMTASGCAAAGRELHQFFDVAQLGVRVGGASGFLKQSPIQRHLRNAQAGQLMAYSTEVLATEIGKEVLGVEAAENEEVA